MIFVAIKDQLTGRYFHWHSRIVQLKAIDDDKAALEKAQNELESYIFYVKSVFDRDMYMQCSTEQERSNVISVAMEMGEWYENQEMDTPKEVSHIIY